MVAQTPRYAKSVSMVLFSFQPIRPVDLHQCFVKENVFPTEF